MSTRRYVEILHACAGGCFSDDAAAPLTSAGGQCSSPTPTRPPSNHASHFWTSTTRENDDATCWILHAARAHTRTHSTHAYIIIRPTVDWLLCNTHETINAICFASINEYMQNSKKHDTSIIRNGVLSSAMVLTVIDTRFGYNKF